MTTKVQCSTLVMSQLLGGIFVHMNAESWVKNPLSKFELEFLMRGFLEWSGPANCTEEMARAIGFESKNDLWNHNAIFRASIVERDGLNSRDWRRLLLAVEIVFASDVIGSGLDWHTTTGWSDSSSIEILRSIQRKMIRAIRDSESLRCC